MKTNLHVFLLCIITIFLLISCYEFLLIDQPEFADPNSAFDVSIIVKTEATDEGGTPKFGVLLPVGWTVVDSISYIGVHNGTFVYSSSASASMQSFSSAPIGYFWWVGEGDTINSLLTGTVSLTPKIQTDSKTGTFFIDYMLAYIFTEEDMGITDVVRSGNYPISVDAPMTVTVTNTNNSGEGSLRQAVSDVSSSGEILFDLSYPAIIILDSQLVVDRSVAITGPESGKLTIRGNSQYRIFNITPRLSVDISNLTISGGNGGIDCYGSELNLDNVLITGNISNGSPGGGLSCSESDVSLKNVRIIENSVNAHEIYDGLSGNGGGIFCRRSTLSFLNVTIANNSADDRGGGIIFVDSCTILFDSDSRSNIYLNNAAIGNDLYSDNNSIVNVVLDTFTVLYPSSYYAHPPKDYTFDILNAKIIQYDADLYVSTIGDDNNIGTSPSEALKTISFAITKIMADSLNPHTIYIDDGIYSPSTNGDDFPLRIPAYVNLSGTTRDGVVLDAENESIVIQLNQQIISSIENITITGGHTGIRCSESILNLNSVKISDNSPDGGISCGSSTLNLTNVILSNNEGSGIRCRDSEASLSSVTITDNMADSGGGISLSRQSILNLTDVKITNNAVTGHGGGIYSPPDNDDSNIYLANVTIAHNFAEGSGGGIYSGGNWIFHSKQRCNIYSNLANVGDDLRYNSSYDNRHIIAVIVDTFTVLDPTMEHTYPIEKFTFDILHAAVTDISEERNNLPTKFALNQNYPNPFNPSTTIEFTLPKSEFVELKVFNILGKEVSTIVSTKLNQGNHNYTFDESNLASGIYYYQLMAGDYRDVKKMILLK